LSKAIELSKSLPSVRIASSPYQKQRAAFLRLLKKAADTGFGRHYRFDEILASPNPMRTFQKNIPIFDYNKIYAEWWHRSLSGEENVCWPGTIKYFALSSGTSESASKRIPVSNEMLKAIKRTGVRQILSLANFEIPENLLDKGYLMIGGSTTLSGRGSYYEGDLSGITAKNIPYWFQQFYKPGRDIASERDWNTKIQKIVAHAKDWDIGFIVGVPAWIQIVIEKIIEHYQVRHIHEIWPNLSVFVHGGVSFEPYKAGFEKLLGKPLIYIETYLASEGFIAYQNRPDTNSMQLVLNNGIFFEFVPFNDENFHPDGSIKENAQAMLIDEIQEGKDYALLLSTNAGSWRYLIGDTIRFTSKKRSEIIITGRTKHFLSLCGEHLSVDNMIHGIGKVASHFQVSIPEFTVSGINSGSLFGHHWFLGTDADISKAEAMEILDRHLQEINDDYATERKHALRELKMEILPLNVFHHWMERQGKLGGQHKFPRVSKNDQLKDWLQHVEAYHKSKVKEQVARS
jgi:hypothetical protein